MFRTIRFATSTIGVITSAALAVGLSGCASSTADAESTPHEAPESSAPAEPSASPSTEPPSPKDVAIEEARPVIEEYFHVRDAIGLDDDFPEENLRKVAFSSALMDLENQKLMMDGPQVQQIGESVVESAEVTEVNLEADSPYVLFRVCADFAAVDVVNEAGESIMSKSPDRSVYQIGVGNDEEHTNGKWLVASEELLEEESC